MKVWLVGVHKEQLKHKWEIAGVFSTEQKAVDVCKTRYFFIMPIIIDKVAPEESVVLEGSYYPIT